MLCGLPSQVYPEQGTATGMNGFLPFIRSGLMPHHQNSPAELVMEVLRDSVRGVTQSNLKDQGAPPAPQFI